MLRTKNRPLNVALWSLCVASVLGFTTPAWAQYGGGDSSSAPTPPEQPSFGDAYSNGSESGITQDLVKPQTVKKKTIKKKTVTGIEFVNTGVMGQPMLPGAVNGTIGPQGSDATEAMTAQPIMSPTMAPSPSPPPMELSAEMSPSSPLPMPVPVPVPKRMERKIGQTESALIIGGAVSLLSLSVLFLFKKKKAAFWTLGAIAAAVLAIAGFAWGSFGLFQ